MSCFLLDIFQKGGGVHGRRQSWLFPVDFGPNLGCIGLFNRVPWFSQHPFMPAALWHSDVRPFLYYNGNYNRKISENRNQKKIIWGTKTHSYELIFHPHIEEGQTKVVCFITKKSMWSRKNWEIEDFSFWLLQWSSTKSGGTEHFGVNPKSLLASLCPVMPYLTRRSGGAYF